MKEGWEYKKLGEIGQIITGNTPSTRDIKNYSSEDRCFVKPSDLGKEGISIISDSEFHISEYAFNSSRQLPIGSILTTCIGTIGKIGILDVQATCNQQINALIPNNDINSVFVAYNLLSQRHLLEKIANAPIVPIINKGLFSEIKIAIPSISHQQQIASELDLLSNIIEKQKVQIAEIENLAKSIFYDMFGDTAINERGWEKKRLEEIVTNDCTISYGIVQPGEGVENGVPVVRPVDMTDTFISLKGLKHTTKEISESYKRTILKGNELLLCVRGTTGLVALSTPELEGCNVTRGITPLEFNIKCDRWFYYYQFLSNGVQQYIADYTKGATLKGINMKDVRNIPLIYPPLALQQEFAAKVEAIEQMKAKVRQSLKETEELFNSRMDYYFN